MTVPETSTPPGYLMYTRPPRVASIVEPAPHHAAQCAVSVKYRNSWFWIDDGDLESKQVFSLIMMLFTMVDTGPRENQPVLTIPAH